MQRQSDVCESVCEAGFLVHGCRRCRDCHLCVCAQCVCACVSLVEASSATISISLTDVGVDLQCSRCWRICAAVHNLLMREFQAMEAERDNFGSSGAWSKSHLRLLKEVVNCTWE